MKTYFSSSTLCCLHRNEKKKTLLFQQILNVLNDPIKTCAEEFIMYYYESLLFVILFIHYISYLFYILYIIYYYYIIIRVYYLLFNGSFWNSKYTGNLSQCISCWGCRDMGNNTWLEKILKKHCTVYIFAPAKFRTKKFQFGEQLWFGKRMQCVFTRVWFSLPSEWFSDFH